MKRTQIYLKEEQYEYLARESKNKGESIAHIIRELIDKKIHSKKSDKKKKSFWDIGEEHDFTTNIKGGSETHDEVIYGSKTNSNAE